MLGGCIADEHAANNGAGGVTDTAPIAALRQKADDPVTAANSLPAAPDAEFSDLSGKTVSLSKLKGKVVFIDFWAPWCAPCRAGLPFTDRLSSQFKDKGLVVLAVSGDPAESVATFMKANHYKFNPLLDSKHFAAKFGVDGIPHTVVIDRGGHIVAEEEGLAPQSETIANLAKAGLDTKGFEPSNDPTLTPTLG